MGKGQALQPDGELHIAGRHHVLDLEVLELSLEAQLLNDAGVLQGSDIIPARNQLIQLHCDTLPNQSSLKRHGERPTELDRTVCCSPADGEMIGRSCSSYLPSCESTVCLCLSAGDHLSDHTETLGCTMRASK